MGKKEEEAKKPAEKTPKWGAAAKKPEETKPKWGSSATTPSATATPAAVDEVPKRKPWEKPSAAAKSTLPSLNESSSSAASKSKVTFNDKARKTSESDSD